MNGHLNGRSLQPLNRGNLGARQTAAGPDWAIRTRTATRSRTSGRCAASPTRSPRRAATAITWSAAPGRTGTPSARPLAASSAATGGTPESPALTRTGMRTRTTIRSTGAYRTGMSSCLRVATRPSRRCQRRYRRSTAQLWPFLAICRWSRPSVRRGLEQPSLAHEWCPPR